MNTLASLMKEMFAKAGLEGNFTNHSGKRTCATSLYEAGLDEQSIMDRTGHRSTAVRAYKTKTDEIEEKVSSALNPPDKENSAGTSNHKQLPVKKIKLEHPDSKDTVRKSLSDITNGAAAHGLVNYNNCTFNIAK